MALAQNWLLRRFEALEYPRGADFSITNASDISAFVTWLEESKIKHFKTDQQKFIKKLQSASSGLENVKAVITEYTKELGSTRDSSDLADQLEWLTAHAIAIEFELNADSYNLEAGDLLREAVPEHAVAAMSDSFDWESAELRAAVNELAAALHVPVHTDMRVTVLALLSLLESTAAAASKAPAKPAPAADSTISLADLPLGLDTGDAELNKAARVLRLLFIADLRELQTTINQLIIAVQNQTANPRTDARLGRVGK